MFFSKKNRKSLTLNTTVFLFSLFLIFSSKSVHSESIVSDARVEVVREDSLTNKKNPTSKTPFPKTNEQINFLIFAIGILIILSSAKLIYDKYGN